MEITTIDLKDIKPHPKNPNQHPKEQLKELQNSLDQFDQVKNIVTWNGYIIAGHGLVEAAKLKGLKTIKAVDVSTWPEEKAMSFMVADNRLPELGIMDDGMLTDLLKGFDDPLDIPGIDDLFLEELGLEVDGKGEGSSDSDDIPEDVEPIVKAGELWLLGEHRLLCSDCTVQGNVEKLMDGEKADMVFTDPPYGVSYAEKNTYLNTISRGNRIQTKIIGDHETVEDLAEKIIYPAFCQIKEALAERSSYYITAPQGGDLLMMMMMMQKAGLPLRHMLIWVKNNHVLGRTNYNYKHEPILFGWVKVHDFYKKGDHKFSTWEINKPLKNDLHPTMKPVELIENAIKNSSKKGNIILDLFLGSGSTLIACEKTNRKCYGMEIDEHYCTIILQRWAQFTGKTPVREDGALFNSLKK